MRASVDNVIKLSQWAGWLSWQIKAPHPPAQTSLHHSRNNSRLRNKPVPDIVDEHSEAFNRAHTEQNHIARLGKHDFIGRLKAFGSETGR